MASGGHILEKDLRVNSTGFLTVCVRRVGGGGIEGEGGGLEYQSAIISILCPPEKVSLAFMYLILLLLKYPLRCP